VSINLSCEQCGAPLGVPDGTRFVTCGHCGARLAVGQGDGAYFSQVLDRIDDRTARIEVSVERLALQNELELLDRDFEAGRIQPRVLGPARLLPPGSEVKIIVAAILGIVALPVVAFLSAEVLNTDGAAATMAYAVVLMVVFGLLNKQLEPPVESAAARYRRERAELVQRLAALDAEGK
jgi:hypothetical protein